MAAFLQSYVVPVCLYEEHQGVATIKQFFGTAFFVNSEGVFLTAAHVLNDASARASATGWKLGLCQKGEQGRSHASVMSTILEYEFASKPYDVAIGISSMPTDTLLSLGGFEMNVWQDVATFGYPSSIAGVEVERFDIGLRCLKGYVQRLVQPGEIKVAPHPKAFELSFPVSRGLSGSPLFVHRNPKDLVVGVCVGSIRSETVDSEFSEVTNDGKHFRERHVKIEEYGLAHDLRGLHDWKPQLLAGRSLAGA